MERNNDYELHERIKGGASAEVSQEPQPEVSAAIPLDRKLDVRIYQACQIHRD